MKCDKCGEIISDFSGICYNCDKAGITRQLDIKKNPGFSSEDKNSIEEQNKYLGENIRAIGKIKEKAFKIIEEKPLVPEKKITETHQEYNIIEEKPLVPDEENIEKNKKFYIPLILLTAFIVIFCIIMPSGPARQKKNIFLKGIKNVKEGIFDSNFHSAITSWNTDKENARVYYFMALSEYYYYLNMEIKGNKPNSLNRVKIKSNLDKALELKPEYPEAFYYRGLYYLEIKDYVSAIKDFNKCIDSAGIIWKSKSEKQFKWGRAAKMAEEEALKLSKEALKPSKETSLKIVPPIMADFCRELELVNYNNGRASIKDKHGNFIFMDKLCPPLPDEISNI